MWAPPSPAQACSRGLAILLSVLLSRLLEPPRPEIQAGRSLEADSLVPVSDSAVRRRAGGRAEGGGRRAEGGGEALGAAREVGEACTRRWKSHRAPFRAHPTAPSFPHIVDRIHSQRADRQSAQASVGQAGPDLSAPDGREREREREGCVDACARLRSHTNVLKHKQSAEDVCTLDPHHPLNLKLRRWDINVGRLVDALTTHCQSAPAAMWQPATSQTPCHVAA